MKLSDFESSRRQILDLKNVSDSDMRTNVAILREWMEKLPHIPSDLLQDEYLEICFTETKFSLEKAKKKIEKYCTYKSLPRYQYLFERYPNPTKENIFYLMNPQLTDDFHRIFIGRIKEENEYVHSEEASNVIVQAEISSRIDYNDGEIYIADYSRCSVFLLSKMRVNVAVDSVKMLFDVFSSRVKSIHLVNERAKLILSFFLRFLPQNIQSKIYLHEDYESLKKMIPAKYLPSDMGGDMKTLDEMLADWDVFYEENRDFITGILATKSREDLRLDDPYKNEMQGTFKKLDID